MKYSIKVLAKLFTFTSIFMKSDKLIKKKELFDFLLDGAKK